MNDNNPPELCELTGTNIVLGVCGSIAAYKAAYLVRELNALGAHVRVVMTQSALAFIQPMTFQALSGNAVHCELLDLQAERAMGHIELARWADYILIAPASADFIAKMAQGLSDDLLSTLCLASTAPIFVCPAMNTHMWMHPATIANCAVLRHRGVILCGPDTGEQACKEIGFGRMLEPDIIITILLLFPIRHLLHGQELLITAGATREAIDPVRYVSNHSSGKMGYALAQAAQIAGARVTLISGPSSLPTPFDVLQIKVNSAQDMLDAVQAQLKPGIIYIGAAAVADYSVSEPQSQKLKRQDQETLTLVLQKNPDILEWVVASQRARLIIGFAAETHDVLQHAADKLRRKKMDMIIANQVGEGLGFESDFNQVTVLTAQQQISLALAPKKTLAGQIIILIAKNLENSVRSSHESLDSN